VKNRSQNLKAFKFSLCRYIEALKAEGNELLAAGDLKLAQTKYEKTYHNLEGLRGLDPEDYDAVCALKRAVLLNLAAVLQRLGEHVEAEARLAKVGLHSC
jgi:tetratricopeptide (TPR) repeat protein